MNFTWMFMVIMPVVVPFFGELGLTPGEVFEVQAIFGLAIVLLEVPTGYVADLVGRKGCLVLAALMHGLAVTWLTYAQGFGGIVVFELLAAVAVCLYSGTDVALLYDSLEALGSTTCAGVVWASASSTCKQGRRARRWLAGGSRSPLCSASLTGTRWWAGCRSSRPCS